MATRDPWELASGARKPGERKKSLRLAGVQPNAVHTLIKLHNWRSRAIYVYHLVERDLKRIDKPTEEQWMDFSSLGVSIPYPSKDAPATDLNGWIDYGKEQAAQLGLEVTNPNSRTPMNFLRISDSFSGGSTEDRFDSTVAYLSMAVGHATFSEGLVKHWTRSETDRNSVSPQSWCWLLCWAITGSGIESAKVESRMAFEKVFDWSNFDSIGMDGEFHRCLRKLRYAEGRPMMEVERELRECIQKSRLEFGS
jgi:hypothetical protein